MPNSHIAEVLQFAISIADLAERQILPVYRNSTVSLKLDGSEATEADRLAEEAMREMIGIRYPEHAILGEEFGGVSLPSDKPTWVLDPIDGTTSFSIGVPLFGTLIGYLENGEPLVGVIHLPAMGETIFAAQGLGCWVKLRGGQPRRVHVGEARDLKDSFVSCSGVGNSDIDPSETGPNYRLSALIPKARKFRFITDCVQYGLVAQGRIDAAMDLLMHPWDIAALVPCVEEAGGVASDLKGNREGIVWKTNLLTSSNRRLHDQILTELKGNHPVLRLD